MGIEVLLCREKLDVTMADIRIRGTVYYRRFPTYREQMGIRRAQAIEDEPDSGEDYSTLSSVNPDAFADHNRFRLVFKKVPFQIEIEDYPLSELTESKRTLASGAAVRKAVHAQIESDLRRYRRVKGKIPKEVLASEDTYNEYVANVISGGRDVERGWDFHVISKQTGYDETTTKISIDLVNTNESPPTDEHDTHLFDLRIELSVSGSEFVPFEVDEIEDLPLVSREVIGLGSNCHVISDSKSEVHSEPMPVFEQKMQISRHHMELPFSELADDPFPILRKLDGTMKEYLEEARSHCTPSSEGRSKRDLEAFEDEIKRFRKGIQCLKKYDLVLEAFQLMNRTFAESSKGFPGWRTFQLVFIVMNITDVACNEYQEIENTQNRVDVIYFPTGGGKTEAYLGLVIFACFFDRLRGKKAGVTAITKFPLRLLSLQQIQRIVDVFGQGEMIRRNHNVISGDEYHPFSTGYYVGEKNTPNVLVNRWKNLDTFADIDRGAVDPDRWKVVTHCPFCGSEDVSVIPNPAETRILHRCASHECGMEIPVYVTDTEIYRYLPTFVVSTLDKFAAAGWQRFFRNLFGFVLKECPLHGYSSLLECMEYRNKNCSVEQSELRDVDLYDPSPCLLIQDEIHLIRESLGTFDSHYETFALWLKEMAAKGNSSMKIVAATATISDFEHQIRHLYLRPGVLFPHPGLDWHRRFYLEETPETERLLLGVMPHNKTQIYCVIDVIRYYEEMLQSYFRNPAVLVENSQCPSIKTEAQALGIIREYSVLLSYNLSKREGDAIGQSVSTQINPDLTRGGFESIAYTPMTGDVTFADVRNVLEKLESDWDRPPIDLVTATSMISHGVDIDRLNFMIFKDMPRNNAEYVQALSRVGRKLPGIVFVMFRPTRERDRSYYKYFGKFHEYKEFLIEPVPINRWARFSIERTLPGLFCAVLFNYVDVENLRKNLSHRVYMTGGFQRLYEEKVLSETEITEYLRTIYGVKEMDEGFLFDRVLEETVPRMFRRILGYRRGSDYIAMVLKNKPMSNFRDIDEQVEISPKADEIEGFMKLEKGV
jgi:hypothetical protein